MSDATELIKNCPDRIEPLRIGKVLHKAELERLVALTGAIQHVVGCIVLALVNRYDVTELTDILHHHVDELSTIGRKDRKTP